MYVLPVLLGGGIPFSSPGLTRVDLEPIGSARSVAGRPLTSHRVRLAAVSYALFSVGLFTMVGVVAGEALSAL